MYIIGSFFGKIFLGDWCNIRVNQYERELINVMTPPPHTHYRIVVHKAILQFIDLM